MIDSKFIPPTRYVHHNGRLLDILTPNGNRKGCVRKVRSRNGGTLMV